MVAHSGRHSDIAADSRGESPHPPRTSDHEQDLWYSSVNSGTVRNFSRSFVLSLATLDYAMVLENFSSNSILEMAP